MADFAPELRNGAVGPGLAFRRLSVTLQRS